MNHKTIHMEYMLFMALYTVSAITNLIFFDELKKFFTYDQNWAWFVTFCPLVNIASMGALTCVKLEKN